MKRKPLIDSKYIGCGFCGTPPEAILDDETVFYVGSVHYMLLTIDDSDFNIENDEGITLSEIEKEYEYELSKCKFAELKHITPLHDETWEYNTEDKKWYLVEQGIGYA